MDTVSSRRDTVTAQGDGTPACQGHGSVAGHGDPSAGYVCALELEAGGSVLEDYGEGAVVRVRTVFRCRIASPRCWSYNHPV